MDGPSCTSRVRRAGVVAPVRRRGGVGVGCPASVVCLPAVPLGHLCRAMEQECAAHRHLHPGASVERRVGVGHDPLMEYVIDLDQPQ